MRNSYDVAAMASGVIGAKPYYDPNVSSSYVEFGMTDGLVPLKLLPAFPRLLYASYSSETIWDVLHWTPFKPLVKTRPYDVGHGTLSAPTRHFLQDGINKICRQIAWSLPFSKLISTIKEVNV